MEKLLKAIQDLEEKIKTKDKNSEKLEAQLSALQEKYDELSEAMLDNNRPNLSNKTKLTKGFINYIKTGTIDNALIESDDSQGGVLVPDDIVSGIDHDIVASSAIAAISNIRPTNKPTVTYHQRISGFEAGHRGETDDVANTNTAQYDDIEINLKHVYANPSVSNDLLDDSDEDIQEEVRNGIGEGISLVLTNDFINGTGTLGPKGILAYEQNKVTKIGEMAYGKLNYMITGKANALADDKPWAIFKKAKRVIPPSILQNSYWVMNSSTAGEVDTMADADGKPLWSNQNNLVEGAPATFCGLKVKIDEAMPDISSGKVFMLLINKNSYQIVKHRKATVIRDSITKKGFTQFYYDQRWCGGIRRFKTLVGIKGAVS